MNTQNLSKLEINKLSARQYSREKLSNNLNNNALYLVPTTSVVPMAGCEIVNNGQADMNGNDVVLSSIINCSLLETLTLDITEQLIYVPLKNDLALQGQKVYFGDDTLSESDQTEITYSKNGIWTSLSDINDGRGWNNDQVLTLLIKGSGELFKFDYVRLLSVPYPLAENTSF